MATHLRDGHEALIEAAFRSITDDRNRPGSYDRPDLGRGIRTLHLLSSREIAALALGHVDDDEQAEIDAAWDDEIDSRVQDILTGKVELVDGEETRRMVRAELAARRHA